MDDFLAKDVRQAVDTVYRTESRRVFATLVRLLGDFDIAEEALHEAFRAALEQWPVEGVPANPRAWLVSAGRFKAIDAIRRNARFADVEDFESFAEFPATSVQHSAAAAELRGFTLIARSFCEIVECLFARNF